MHLGNTTNPYNLNKDSDTYQPSGADIADFLIPLHLPTVAEEVLQQLNNPLLLGLELVGFGKSHQALD